MIYIGNTQSVIASHSCFCSFFHQSSLYPIKIFAKCFYLLVCILFSAPTLSELKLIIFLFFVNRQCTNGHGVNIIGVNIIGIIGSRFATLLHHSLVQRPLKLQWYVSCVFLDMKGD